MIPAARGLGQQRGRDRGRPGARGRGRAAARSRPTSCSSSASALEGHPDNVAAALYGGFTVALAEPMGASPCAGSGCRRRGSRSPSSRSARAARPRCAPPCRQAVDACRGGAPGGPQRTAGDGDHDVGRGPPAHRHDRRAPPALSPAAAARRAATSSSWPTSAGRPGRACPAPAPRSSPSATRRRRRHAVEKAWNASGQAGMATRLRFDTAGAKLVAD